MSTATAAQANSLLDRIYENNAHWVDQQTHDDPEHFKTISCGQSPEILYIGCSDSRCTAESIMGAKEGEVFVHRNVANLVNSMDLGMTSTIEYAVVHLKVKHIVVCGHYNCGGVKAAMSSSDLGVLNPWLSQIRDVYRTHKHALSQLEDEGERYKKLVELNCQEQCLNLLKLKSVQDAYRNGELNLHGWVYNMFNGRLIDLHLDMKSLTSGIEDIYKLQD